MKDSSNKGFWQRWAGSYAPFMKSSAGLYRAVCDGIRPHLDRGMDVLELACGTGQLSFPLSDFVKSWEATDFSPAMICQAQKTTGPAQLHFSVQDATDLTYGSNTFDVVVISNALHIMPHPELALAEIRRVLKPGGLLFAPTFIHGEGFGFRLRVRLMELVGFHTFYQWDREQFLAYLGNHSFEVVEQRLLGGGLTPLCFAVARPIPKLSA